MTERSYPAEPAERFPRPPDRMTDAEGCQIALERIEPGDGATRERLVEMYRAFDSSDRAQGIPPVVEADIREWLQLILEGGPDVVAAHGQQVVGHATLVPEQATAEYELAIFVLQGYQGRGIGSRLLRVLLGAAQAAGIEYVWLTVERWNWRAIRLYESVGFESTEAGSFDLEMTLRLLASGG